MAFPLLFLDHVFWCWFQQCRREVRLLLISRRKSHVHRRSLQSQRRVCIRFVQSPLMVRSHWTTANANLQTNVNEHSANVFWNDFYARLGLYQVSRLRLRQMSRMGCMVFTFNIYINRDVTFECSLSSFGFLSHFAFAIVQCEDGTRKMFRNCVWIHFCYSLLIQNQIATTLKHKAARFVLIFPLLIPHQRFAFLHINPNLS